MGMSPEKLDEFLTARAFPDRDGCRERSSGRRIAACVPMHTFGHPCRIEEICAICGRYGIPVVEDAAEALGSLYKGRHAGTYGRAGIFSFNGNKGVTTGGGGMVISDDEKLSQKLRFITSTAKRSHPWEYVHEEVGYNLRMPNINAALGCAQMEYFDRILQNKRETASIYAGFFGARGVRLIVEGPSSRSNYWLNAIALEDRASRDLFLEYTNANGVQTRPVWALMSDLPPYRDCLHGELGASRWLADHLVNIPSSVRIQ
jgi:dTDP-4-amino-4,6-dideoxygalactose transaminase